MGHAFLVSWGYGRSVAAVQPQFQVLGSPVAGREVVVPLARSVFVVPRRELRPEKAECHGVLDGWGDGFHTANLDYQWY